MAKNYYILITLFVVAAFGCGKDKTPVNPYYEPTDGDLKYTIEGVRDVSMERTGEAQFTLLINRTEGKIEDVSLAASGLPQGATATFIPQVGKPSFNTTLVLKATRTPVGEYTITIRGTSLTSGFTDQTLKMKILPYVNAATGMVGLFKENGFCSPSGQAGDTVDIVTTAAVNQINIKGFWSGVWTNMVYANLNPFNKTLDIPSQSVNGLTIKGSGTYDDNTITVGYRVTGPLVNDTCNSVFNRL